MMARTLRLIGALATAIVFGGMVYFAAVAAPVAFTSLSREAAALHMRAQFPPYYVSMAGASGVAALALAASERGAAAAMGAVGIGFIAARQFLLPATAAARDRAEAGDAEGGRRFALLHRISLVINLAQMVVSGGVLARLVTPRH